VTSLVAPAPPRKAFHPGAANVLTVSRMDECEQIEHVVAHACLGGTAPQEVLSALLSACPGLKTLYLLRCRNLTSILPLALGALTRLTLDGCCGVTDFTPLAACVTLTHLDIQGQEVKTLDWLSGLQWLQELALVACVDLKDISELSELYWLHTLNLSCCRALADLGPLADCPSLHTLDLSGTKVDLAPLGRCSPLARLDLSMRDADLALLSSNCTLGRLTLSKYQEYENEDKLPDSVTVDRV
jgi:Leucine-rich repeat (LRR) protein